MTEQRQANKGWFARWRAHRRIERQEARERERVAQEQLARLLREYPLEADHLRHTRTQMSSSGISSSWFWHGDGGWGWGGDDDGGGCWGGDDGGGWGWGGGWGGWGSGGDGGGGGC
jgi:hypothetical protein